MTVKLFHSFAHLRHAPGQVAKQIVLIAAVDTQVRISRPQQHAVDASVALIQVREVTVHRVLQRARIVEEAIVNHHLRLNKTRLRPQKLPARILRSLITHSQQMFGAPMLHVLAPFFNLSFCASGGTRSIPVGSRFARWCRNLFAVRGTDCVLCKRS